MDLGSKVLNNLISKNPALQKQAARDIVQNSDVEALNILNLKSEFIFDFLKEKILKNLISSVSADNYKNLFGFTKIYAPDFKSFIIAPLVKFNSPFVEEKMLGLLTGTDGEKTYAVEFFTILRQKDIYKYVQKFLNSNFEPLKLASIKYLKELNLRDEFNEKIQVLSSKKDDFDKLEAVCFLSAYGDVAAFSPIYHYFKTNNSYLAALSLIELKPFYKLIKENLEEETLNIFLSILNEFPENITFFEINSYLKEGVFEFLIENENNFAFLILIYLKIKTDLILDNEAYSIDLDRFEKLELKELNSILKNALSGFSVEKAIKEALLSNKNEEIITALNILKELEEKPAKEELYALLEKNNDPEIIISALYLLNGKIDESLKNLVLSKFENETIKAEILNLTK